jgi:uncharacterized membrane protein
MMYGFNLGSGDTVMMFFFGFVAIALGVLAWRLFFSSPSTHQPSPVGSAEDSARLRYSCGEISRDEYLQILSDLDYTDSNIDSKAKRSEW